MAISPKKRATGKDKQASLLVRKVAAQIIANKGKTTMAAAIRAAGGSRTAIKNPQLISRNKGFIKILEKAGLTDDALAKAHNDLMQSSHIESQIFRSIKSEVLITKGKNGRKLKKPKIDIQFVDIPDEEIKMQIESVPGYRVLRIYPGYQEKTVYFQVPENAVRKSAIEMGYKVKDHFAPDKLDVVEHQLSEDERNLLSGLMGNE